MRFDNEVTHQYITVLPSHPEVFYVEGSYDASFIDELKKGIPWQERTWDKENKRWEIDIRHMDAVTVQAKAHFDKVYLVTGGGSEEL